MTHLQLKPRFEIAQKRIGLALALSAALCDVSLSLFLVHDGMFLGRPLPPTVCPTPEVSRWTGPPRPAISAGIMSPGMP